MPERVDLEVPFAEKDRAKSLGARWDPTARTWYVPAGLNQRDFQRWLPAGEDGGDTELVAPVFVVESRTRCWRCDEEPRVATVAAESFIPDGESAEAVRPDLYLFSGIEVLPRELVAAMRKVNPGYKRRFSETAGVGYYMNHCTCGAKLGDHYMHSEPGGAFFPTTAPAARAMRLVRLEVQGSLYITGDPSFVHPNLVLQYAERTEAPS